MQVRLLALLILVLALASAGGGWAQTSGATRTASQPTPQAAPKVAAIAQELVAPTPQFDFLGFIQEATLDTQFTICVPPVDPTTQTPSLRLAGGTMTVNGIRMTVPCNTILQLPATSMTWADLFDRTVAAPLSDPSRPGGTVIGSVPVQAIGQTRLALADDPMPFPSFEVHAQGNVVNGEYIVGLIAPVSQQGLNSGSGLISYIDYGLGAFRVGGTANDANCATYGITSTLCSGALIQINDPVGRWGLIHSPDPRFTSDTSWPTIRASTGFPVCIPRVAPPSVDAQCPLGNRPLNGDSRFSTDPFLATGAPLKIFDMKPPPGAAGADPSGFPDPRKQVPMMVGDQVIYSGTLYKIDPNGANTRANTYLSAHTLEDVLGIFTAPGVNPAYVNVEGLLTGAGGAAVQGIKQESSTRLTVVGFTTDPTRLVDIYAIDVNPCTGAQTERAMARTDPASEPIRGRFVHRVLGGLFTPPTREYIVRLVDGDYLDGSGNEILVANGLQSGRYTLPNFDFIFPENHRLGDPFVPFNFQDLPFLAQGSGPLDDSGTMVRQLDPWPGSPTPATASCSSAGARPIVDAGPNIGVATGSLVRLAGTARLDSNSVGASILWTQAATDTVGVALANPTTLTPSFTAPDVTTTTLNFRLSVTDQFGTGRDSVTITVFRATDIVQLPAGAAAWATATGSRGGFGKLDASATSSNPAAVLTLTEIDVDGAVVEWGTGTANPLEPGRYDWRELKGAPPPASLIIRSSKGGSYTATCDAQDDRGRIACR